MFNFSIILNRIVVVATTGFIMDDEIREISRYFES